MQSFNRVILVGRMVADPEERYSATGRKVVRFRIAVDRRPRTSSTGEQIKETDFFNIVAFRDNVTNFVSTYLGKGRLVLVEGELRRRKWTDPSGQRRVIYEIVAFRVDPLDRKPSAGGFGEAFGTSEPVLDYEESLQETEETIDLNEELEEEGSEEIPPDEDEPPY